MSQEQVYQVLKKEKKWLNSLEIHQLLVKQGVTIMRGSVSINLAKLRKNGFIMRKPLPHPIKYAYKIKPMKKEA